MKGINLIRSEAVQRNRSVDMMQLHLLLAQFELIKARTAEGRERAKGRGVRMGRKHKLTPHQQDEVRKRKAEGQSVRELGRSYNVSPNTISRVR